MLLRPSKLLALPVLATTMLTMAACGDDGPTGNSGDSLTPVEAGFLVDAFFGALQLIDIPLLETTPAAGPARTPYGDLYDDEIVGTTDCFDGFASIAGLITGDVDEQAGTADLAATAAVDFEGCVVLGETVVFTLDGAPDIGIAVDIDITDELLSITIDADGAVAFSTNDGRTGTCAIDVTVAATASDVAGVNEVITGSACGANAAQLNITLFD